MSELVNAQSRSKSVRWNLLTHASLFALASHFGLSEMASAATANEDAPTLWIELGGQFERMDGAPTTFSPPFFNQASPVGRDTMINAQRPSPFSIGGEGKITFAPQDTKWVLSASVRYGRSNSDRHLHSQTPGIPSTFLSFFGVREEFTPNKRVFADDQAESDATHFLLDFQAGKDVGLGLFGSSGNSIISAGVRFAQFTSNSDATIHARPAYSFGQIVEQPGKYRFIQPLYQSNTAVLHAKRSTRAVGPSVSWDAAAPLVNGGSDMTLTLDWGIKAAFLFGRQHAALNHQTTGRYFHRTLHLSHPGFRIVYNTTHYAHSTNHNRIHSVTIPNIGGFAGASLKFVNAKISLGYRADFFFEAMDDGIDTARKTDVGFYGPFATISVGF